MKRLLTIFLFALPFLAQAQHDYISSSGNVVLVSGSIERYASPDIYVTHCTQIREGVVYWIATVSLYEPATTEGIIKTWQYEFDEATLDAFTPTGATNTEDMKNVMLQAVEVELIAATGSDIFTLN